jgi:hypothetical protein
MRSSSSAVTGCPVRGGRLIATLLSRLALDHDNHLAFAVNNLGDSWDTGLPPQTLTIAKKTKQKGD